jgi:O-antigen/teichoic acid export membrane protein
MRSAVAWTFLATLLRVGANVIILPLILRKLPPEHLGLWYVFAAIGGFASLLDFGFEPTITRMTSYAWGGASRLIAFGLHQDEVKSSVTPEPNRALIADLVATLRAYYFWVGLGVLFLLGVGGGIWIWIQTEQLPAATSLRLAWLVYAFGCCLNFISGRWPAMLTGIGALKEGQHITIFSLLFYYAVAVTGLLTGFGIWGLVLAVLAMGWGLRSFGRHIFRRLAALPGGLPSACFHQEIFSAIWPNAWRMGLVSLAAFLATTANTLVCGAFLGLKTTASYGISLQLMTLLSSLSAVWVQVKMPAINQLRLQNRDEEIVRIFVSRTRLFILSYLTGTLAILFLAPDAFRMIGSKTMLIPFGPLAVLALILFLEMHHWLYAQLVLSENHNPFLKPALISGTAIVLASILLTPKLGIWGLLISRGVIQACYNNWWPVGRALRGLKLKPCRYFFRFFFQR